MDAAQRIGIAIVRHAQHVLVGVRQADQVLAGMAELPGGKCEPGESAAQCAARECLEETGLGVEPLEVLEQVLQRYAHGVVELHFVACRLLGDESAELPQPANSFRWIPITELSTLEFPEANHSIIQRLVNEDF